MRVLLIEDEAQLREQIAAFLRMKGMHVDTVGTGDDGLRAGNEQPLDVAIVDLGLPDISGLDVIKQWRRGGRTLPVLILTARGTWQDKVAGLETGADDYLVKPFHLEELVARLRALKRRTQKSSERIICCGPIAIEPSSQKVTIHGDEVELTAFEYKVLVYLIKHAGHVVSKSRLAEIMYEEEMERESNVVEVIVGRLRRKLDPDRDLKLIQTRRGSGYLLRYDGPQTDVVD
jgi:two-component system response regulator PhoP